jgi:MFS family permease
MNSAPTRKVIAAGMIGNVLEWYDFAIYGYFAASIGRHFFPREDAVAQLLAAFGVFALGYLVRPIGGALIGHIGDRYGRRTALTVSVSAMAVPTFLMGLLPGYETLGLLAPIALVLLRMIQGLSVGGEYTSSMVFLVERAPADHRGLMGAFICCGTTIGILLGSGVGATIAATMTTETLDAWGWRIPFLLGIVVGVAGFILRRHVIEAAPVERGERQPDRRDLARPLAAGRAACRAFRVQRGELLCDVRLRGELAADRRRNLARSRARDQHHQHDDPVAGAAGLGLAVGSLWSQTHFDSVDRARSSGRAAAVLGHLSSFPAPDPVGTDGLRPGDRPLRRHAGDHHGRIRARADSLHGGGIGL